MDKRLVDELQLLLDSLAARLAHSVAIDAPDGELVAVSRDYGDADRYRINLLLERHMPDAARTYFQPYIAKSTPGRPVHVPKNTQLSIGARWCYNIGDGLAYLWIIDRGMPLDETAIASFTDRMHALLAERSTQWLTHNDTASTELIVRILLGAVGEETVDQAKHGQFVIACTDTRGSSATGPASETLRRALRSAQLYGFQVRAGTEEDGFSVLALEHVRQLEEFDDSYASLLLDVERHLADSSQGFTVGMSGGSGVAHLRTLLGRACVAQVIGQHLFVQERVTDWHDVSHLLPVGGRRPTVGRNPRVAVFSELLRDRGSSVFDTTAALLRASHGSSSASLLHIHRTTLHYRMRQILQHSGIDLSAAPDRHLAFTAWFHELCHRRIGKSLLAAVTADAQPEPLHTLRGNN